MKPAESGSRTAVPEGEPRRGVRVIFGNQFFDKLKGRTGRYDLSIGFRRSSFLFVNVGFEASQQIQSRRAVPEALRDQSAKPCLADFVQLLVSKNLSLAAPYRHNNLGIKFT